MRVAVNPVKSVAFALCAVPLGLLAVQLLDGSLIANPMPAVIRSTGIWSLRLMIAGLALSPLGSITGWDWPRRLRRMVGLFAALYAAVHLIAWARYYNYDFGFLAGEIVAVPFLAVGLLGAILLAPMVLTSHHRVHARLGPVVWGRIHTLIYPTVVLVYVHDLMARRFDRTEAAITGVLIVMAVGWRVRQLRVRRVVVAH